MKHHSICIHKDDYTKIITCAGYYVKIAMVKVIESVNSVLLVGFLLLLWQFSMIIFTTKCIFNLYYQFQNINR